MNSFTESEKEAILFHVSEFLGKDVWQKFYRDDRGIIKVSIKNKNHLSNPKQ